MKSDLGTDPDDGKDNQARKEPIRHGVTSYWETEHQETIAKAQFRKPGTTPKVLSCRKGKFPLANWTSVDKGQGHNPPNEIQDDGHDISNNPFPRRDLDTEMDPVVMASINRSQAYPPILPSCKPRKELANWIWVWLGNPKPKINNLEAAEQRHWQRQNGNTDNKTLKRPGDTTKPELVEEEDHLQSDASEKNEKGHGRLSEDVE